MNVLFTREGCPKCKMAKEVTLLLNPKLPWSRRISMVDIYSSDPRLLVLKKMLGEEQAPVLVLEKPKVVKTLGTYNLKYSNDYAIISIHDRDHYLAMVSGLLGVAI